MLLMEVHYLLPVTEELFASKSYSVVIDVHYVISWLAINNINVQLFSNQQMLITVKPLKSSPYFVATLFLARTTKIISKSLKIEHL